MARRPAKARLSKADRSAARSRRRFARRQWRRRWLVWRYVVAVVVVAVLAGTGIWAFYFSSWLSVHDVRVSGQSTVSAADVRRAARVPEGEALARVDLAAVRARVEALAPVKSAEVTRQWPDGVSVRVVERQPVAVVEIGGTLRGMDATGVVFRDYRQAPGNLPRVRTELGTSAAALREAAEVISALPTALSATVDYIQVTTIDEISLVLRDGRVVEWGSAQDSATKAKVLVPLLQQPGQRFDVSVPNQPVTAP